MLTGTRSIETKSRPGTQIGPFMQDCESGSDTVLPKSTAKASNVKTA